MQTTYFEGALIKPNPSTFFVVINNIITEINNIEAGLITLSTVEVANGTAALPSITFGSDLTTGLYRIGASEIGLTLAGTLSVDFAVNLTTFTGAIVSTGTTDSTTSITGAVKTAGGLGVAKAIGLGTNLLLSKEVDHTVTVTTTTTAATVGGALDIVSGAGATSGNGGEASISSGAGGVTGAGGVLNTTSGAGGATSGASGAVNISSGVATIGSSGIITIASGNTASGVAGDIQITPGTHTSTTVSPNISLNKSVIRKPILTSAATGATLTAVQLLGGYIEITGGTGNITLPATSTITTAIGSTPAGTYFDFIINAVNMTATNVVTVVLGSSMTTQKQVSSGDSANDQLLTVTQTSGLNVGSFRLVFITATTTALQRLA